MMDEHEVDVGLGVVVAEDRGALSGGGGEVVVAGAEVDGGGERGVVDVLRVALAVAVGVDPDHGPRGGDELHGSDGVVVDGVVVELAGVGVADDGGVVPAVEGDAVDEGVETPSASREVPPKRPWLDSTRPIAAISCQLRLQDSSAELMTVSARW